MKEKIETPSNVFEGMEFAFRRLERYKAQGYLFHGGKERIPTLVPRQASDTDKSKVIGNQKAVYADPSLQIPIIMALLDKKDHNLRGWRSRYSYTGTHLEVSGENFTLTPGYVHVLPINSFIEIEDEKTGNKEIVSYELVIPRDVVRVTPEILSYLSNVKVLES